MGVNYMDSELQKVFNEGVKFGEIRTHFKRLIDEIIYAEDSKKATRLYGKQLDEKYKVLMGLALTYKKDSNGYPYRSEITGLYEKVMGCQNIKFIPWDDKFNKDPPYSLYV